MKQWRADNQFDFDYELDEKSELFLGEIFSMHVRGLEFRAIIDQEMKRRDLTWKNEDWGAMLYWGEAPIAQIKLRQIGPNEFMIFSKWWTEE